MGGDAGGIPLRGFQPGLAPAAFPLKDPLVKTVIVLAAAALLAGCADPLANGPSDPTPPPLVETKAPEPKPGPKPAPEAEPKPAPQRGKVTEIQLDQIFELRQQDRVLMIDVRRSFFHQLGHIEGSLPLPLADFEKAYPAVKPQLDAAVRAGKVLVTYCQSESCPDSRTAAEALADRGYGVSFYRSGLEEWRAVGVE